MYISKFNILSISSFPLFRLIYLLEIFLSLLLPRYIYLNLYSESMDFSPHFEHGNETFTSITCEDVNDSDKKIFNLNMDIQCDFLADTYIK